MKCVGGGISYCLVCQLKVVRAGFKRWSRCSLAALAQFFPKKHPDHWHVLVGSLVAYAICTMVLNALLWRMENDAFLFAVSDSQSVCIPPTCHPSTMHRFMSSACPQVCQQRPVGAPGQNTVLRKAPQRLLTGRRCSFRERHHNMLALRKPVHAVACSICLARHAGGGAGGGARAGQCWHSIIVVGDAQVSGPVHTRVQTTGEPSW